MTLARCPWCRQVPIFDRNRTDGWVRVVCSHRNDCPVHPSTKWAPDDREETAAAMWNQFAAGTRAGIERGLVALARRWAGETCWSQQAGGNPACGEGRSRCGPCEARTLLARLSAPQEPAATVEAPSTDSAANAAWLRENGAAHEGNWVALKDGELVAEHKSRRALTHRLREDGRLEGVMLVSLFREDPAADPPRRGERTWEEERADVVAWLRGIEPEHLPADDDAAGLSILQRIERGDHLGSSTTSRRPGGG